jgi:hypothetical protein
MLALLLVAGMLQQQPRSTTVAQQEKAAAFDSTTRLVVAVGSAVADVKSYLDLFRRAVFNGLDADVVSSAAALGYRCDTLRSSAFQAARKVCQHCGARDVQQALEGYRGVMPELARTGASCGARLARLLAAGGTQHDEAQGLRHAVRVIGNQIVAGIVPYERRLQVLRVAAGWAPAPVPAASDRPSPP